MPNCPQCGAELDSGDPAGLCPKCLILGAFESSVGAEDSETQTIDTAAAAAGDDDFGRYQIVRPLGEGGMGTVYLAEQRDPIRRLVALKVVKLGMDTAQVLARFDNERQALAMMDHPNIAQIFDAGATGKGRPYFVMEYIEGAPITQYCDRKRMTTRERLALFLAVCRAVQHAHQKGVIHRDLKPSNVLVTEQDGAPVPKVIDFGIAKATDKWAVESTLLTQFGQIVGTPEYASPEQADTMTGEIDEASDVYSLGVLLVRAADRSRAVRHGHAAQRRFGGNAANDPRRRSAVATAKAYLHGRGSERHCRAPPDRPGFAAPPGRWRPELDHDEGAREDARTALCFGVRPRRRYPEVHGAPARAGLTARQSCTEPGSFSAGTGWRAIGTAAGVLFLLLSGVTAWSLSNRDSASRPKLTEKDTIVLADFDNKTGDPVFDDTLREGLSVELQQSPFLSLIGDQQVQQTLALMGQPKDARLTPEIAQQVCERTGSAAVLEGSIASLGSQYVLGLRAKNCSTGNLLDQEQIQAAKREDVLNALSQIARKFRTRVGESLATVEKHSTPLAEATTSSLEALKAYSTGMKANVSAGEVAAAIPFFRRAVEIDPQFAMAYANLGLSYSTHRRVRVVGREHHKSLATAGSRQRPGEVFHRLHLRPAGDGKSGKGVPNPRVVVSDVSSRSGPERPGFVSRPFQPMGQADLKGRSRHPKRNSRPIPTLALRTAILRPAIFSSTASPKPRALFSEPPNASWRARLIW